MSSTQHSAVVFVPVHNLRTLYKSIKILLHVPHQVSLCLFCFFFTLPHAHCLIKLCIFENTKHMNTHKESSLSAFPVLSIWCRHNVTKQNYLLDVATELDNRKEKKAEKPKQQHVKGQRLMAPIYHGN